MFSSNIRGGWLASPFTKTKSFHGGASHVRPLISEQPIETRNTLEHVIGMMPSEDKEFYAKFQLPTGGRARNKYGRVPYKRSKNIIGGQTLPPVWGEGGNRAVINATLQNANPASVNVEDENMDEDENTGVNIIAAQTVSNSAPPQPPPAPVNQRVPIAQHWTLQSQIMLSILVSKVKQVIIADYDAFPPNENPYDIVTWGTALFVFKPRSNEEDAQLKEMLAILRDKGNELYFWYGNEKDENAIIDEIGEDQIEMMDRTYTANDYYADFMSEIRSQYKTHVAVLTYYVEQYIVSSGHGSIIEIQLGEQKTVSTAPGLAGPAAPAAKRAVPATYNIAVDASDESVNQQIAVASANYEATIDAMKRKITEYEAQIIQLTNSLSAKDKQILANGEEIANAVAKAKQEVTQRVETEKAQEIQVIEQRYIARVQKAEEIASGLKRELQSRIQVNDSSIKSLQEEKAALTAALSGAQQESSQGKIQLQNSAAEIQNLLSELEKAQQESKQGRVKLETSAAEIQNLMAQLEKAKKESGEEKNQLQASTSEIQKLMEQLERSKQETGEGKIQLQASTSEVRRLQRELEKVKQDLETAQAAVREGEESKRTVANLKGQVERLTEQYNTARQTVSANEAKIRQMEQAAQTAKASLEAKIATAETKAETAKAALKSSAEQEKLEIQQRYEQNKKELTETIVKLRGDIALNEEKIRKLTGEQKEADLAMKKLVTEKQSLTRDITAVRKELFDLKKKDSSNTEQIAALTARKQELQLKLTENANQYRLAQQEYEETVAHLNSELENAKRTMEEQQNRIRTLEEMLHNERTKYQNDLAAAQQQVVETTERLEKERDDRIAKVVEEYDAQIAKLKTDNETAMKEVREEAEKIKAELEQEIARLTSEKDKIIQDLRDANHELEQVLNKLKADKEKEIAELEKKLADVKSVIFRTLKGEQLPDEYLAYKDFAAQIRLILDQRIANAITKEKQSLFAVQQQKDAVTQARISTLERANAALQQELVSANKVSSGAQVELEGLKQQLVAAGSNYDKVMASLTDAKAELEAEHLRGAQNLEEYQKKIDDLTRQLTLSSQEILSLQKRVEEMTAQIKEAASSPVEAIASLNSCLDLTQKLKDDVLVQTIVAFSSVIFSIGTITVTSQ